MCPPVSALQSVQVTAERKGGRTNCWSVSCQVETVYADHRSSIHVVPMQKCCLFCYHFSFFFHSRGKNSNVLWETQMLPWSSFGFFLVHLSRGFLCSVPDVHHSLWRGKEHWSCLCFSRRLLLWIEWACKSRELNKLHLTQCKYWPASKWPCLMIKNCCFSALDPAILQYQSNTNWQNY